VARQLEEEGSLLKDPVVVHRSPNQGLLCSCQGATLEAGSSRQVLMEDSLVVVETWGKEEKEDSEV
jgi:hypothetical protein